MLSLQTAVAVPSTDIQTRARGRRGQQIGTRRMSPRTASRSGIAVTTKTRGRGHRPGLRGDIARQDRAASDTLVHLAHAHKIGGRRATTEKAATILVNTIGHARRGDLRLRRKVLSVATGTMKVAAGTSETSTGIPAHGAAAPRLLRQRASGASEGGAGPPRPLNPTTTRPIRSSILRKVRLSLTEANPRWTSTFLQRTTRRSMYP